MISIWEQIIVFVIIFIIFSPLLSKVVRLASRTWDERENLDKKRVRQVLIFTPLLVLLVFLLVYYGVVALVNLLLFS